MCLFFMLLSLMMSAFTLVTGAQSGHGGSTEVIARIEPQTEAPTAAEPTSADETQPLPNQPSSADGTPIQTGEAMAWAALIALIVSVVLIVAFRLNRQNRV